MNHRSLPTVSIAASLLLFGLMLGCQPQPGQQQGRMQQPGNNGWNSPQTRNPNQNPNQNANRPQPKDEFEKNRDAPVTADTRFAAGQFAEAQGATEPAMEQYEQALKLNPNHTDTLFRMGVLRTKMRQFPEAVSLWNRYLKATGGSPTGYANLGFALELAGRTNEAEAAYLKGIHRDPTNAPCRVNYGLLLARHNRMNEAVLEMQTVLSEAQVHYNLAGVYETMGRKEQAKVEYRKALDLEPQMKEAQARLETLN